MYFTTIFRKFLIVVEKDINILNWRIVRQHMNNWHRQYGAKSDTHTA